MYPYYAKTHSVYEKHTLFETGLLKHHTKPWLAVSPDGILRLEGSHGTAFVLVEYKCPARLRDSEGHPYATSPDSVPEYYMDQMQGIMGLINTTPVDSTSVLKMAQESVGLPVKSGPMLWALFVVWQPHQLHVTLVPYRPSYYTEFLEPKLSTWYFQKYLPAAVLKFNGTLVQGTASAAAVIVV
jgi:hypothetical protein